MQKPEEASTEEDGTAAALPAELVWIGRGLQHYYQLHSVGPTPKRLQMLLNELMHRTEAMRE